MARSRFFAVVLLGLLQLAAHPLRPAAAQDYLSADLRQKVEQLKRDVADSPTDPSTYRQRGELVWQWGNALALTGVPVPQDLGILGRLARDETPYAAPIGEWVDRYVHELQIKDEQPGALGTLSLAEKGPLVANSWQTLTQTWTVGSLGMRQGGTIAIGADGFNDQGPLQATAPSGDNYLRVGSSNPAARFRPGPGAANQLPSRFVLTLVLEGTDLAPGDRVRMIALCALASGITAS